MDTPTNYHRLIAFHDNGWLGALKPIQTHVWISYLRHASPDGIAWPGATRIAKALGHTSTAHVLRARRQLVKLGLLELVKPGGGFESSRYRVCDPPLREIGAGSESAQGPNRNTTLREIGAGPLREIGTPPCAESEHITDKRTDKQTDHKNKPASRERLCDLELPFESDSFKRAWEEFQAHRREMRKPVTLTGAAKLLKALQAMGETEAVEAIERSIASGWQGIFPPRTTTAKTTNRRAGEYAETPLL